MDHAARAKDLEYPKLRHLEFFPVREGETQSVGLRDPQGLSEDILFLPPNVFYILQFLDGGHTRNQIAAEYLRRFGEILMPNWMDKFLADLDAKLFLEGERVEEAKKKLVDEYRVWTVRPSAHAGKSYEADPEKLRQQIDGFFLSKEGPSKAPSENAGKAIKGIVAPHAELATAGPLYAWAYKEIREARTPDVFVILGAARGIIETLYACTEKDFDTPLGLVRTDHEFCRIFRETGGGIFFDEEIVHRKDHAIEFQTLMLQYLFGGKKAFTIVPILCSFSHLHFSHPDLTEQARRIPEFLEAFRASLATFGKDVCFIASGDLAHIGMRYGDPKPPTDFQFNKTMQADLTMLKHAETGDAQGFLRFIQREDDVRRVGLLPPLYTMLEVMPKAVGTVLRYDRATVDQYNSTMTYAAMSFY